MDRKITFLVLILFFFSGFINALTVEEINSMEGTPIVIVSSEGCPHCAKVEAFIQSIENNYTEVNFVRLKINQNVELVNSLYIKYGVPTEKQGAVPLMFIADEYYLGDAPIIENIENEIQEKKGTKLIGKETNQIESNLFLQLIGLAAVDAVNPCELAVLIILMTAILSRYPKEKGKALKAGLLFSLAIFIMYFIFGILLKSIFSIISGALGTAFMIIIALLAIIIGLMNLKDAFAYGAGGFVIEVPQRWRPKMKSIIKGTTSPKGAFVVGLIVSFFLTPCTAGPYFIFSGLLAQLTLINALPLIFIYMLIFISPMIAITLITYFGFAKVENMGEWRERNIQKLHFIAGILMLLIGLWLILSLLGFL